MFSKLPLALNLACAWQLGFDKVEFNMKCVERESTDCIYTVRRLLGEYGLECSSVHAATLHVENESEVPTAIYYGKVSADFVYTLSSPVLVVHSNVSRRLPTNLRRRFMAQIFAEIRGYAERLGVRLALENLSYASSGFGKNVAEIEEILNVVDDGSMGLTLDFCHAEATGQTMNILGKFARRLLNVHLSNRAHRPFAGDSPRLNEFLLKLEEIGYGGPLTLELSPKSNFEEILKTKIIVQKTLNRE
ncbi:MAG: sugar phosphate isomerase/epimerase family protein [Candidatus Bathyarchaeia archaeon]